MIEVTVGILVAVIALVDLAEHYQSLVFQTHISLIMSREDMEIVLSKKNEEKEKALGKVVY